MPPRMPGSRSPWRSQFLFVLAVLVHDLVIRIVELLAVLAAGQMVYQAEKTLGEMGDKIPEGDKAGVQSAIDKLKETLKGEDTAAIKADTEALQQAFFVAAAISRSPWRTLTSTEV